MARKLSKIPEFLKKCKIFKGIAIGLGRNTGPGEATYGDTMRSMQRRGKGTKIKSV